ncbi:MAG: acyl carrier protein [Lachnospiraceae bacterium]|nr:acyl carrier protein [Lachnospiraceae bacterium]
MEKARIGTAILKSLDEIGVFIDDIEKEDDFDLREYLLDSIQFISFIIELEMELDVEIPSELLLFDNLSSFFSFGEMILGLTKETEECYV